MVKETTLCYIEQDGRYLMLYRNKKKNDPNAGKWIGIGGHMEPKETPEQCVLREVKEETGLELVEYQYRGILNFISDQWDDERIHLFTATKYIGNLAMCNEGDLAWIKKERVPDLPLWEGDREFLKLLTRDTGFFRMRLEYRGETLIDSSYQIVE